MSEQPDRLGAIAHWMQREDETLLYDPDGHHAPYHTLLRPTYYILEGHTPVPIADPLIWAQRFEALEERRVGATWLTQTIWVSTVFLGLDHQDGSGPPLLFESMVFGLPDSHALAQACRRYSTWEEAEAGHAALVAEVQAAP